jgi:predicted naringenin-chalcone synthase
MFLLRCLVLPQDAQEPVLSDLDVLRVHHVVAEAAVGGVFFPSVSFFLARAVPLRPNNGRRKVEVGCNTTRRGLAP